MSENKRLKLHIEETQVFEEEYSENIFQRFTWFQIPEVYLSCTEVQLYPLLLFCMQGIMNTEHKMLTWALAICI